MLILPTSSISVFPARNCSPVNSLYSLRVWLRVNAIDHRIFAEDELWVGKDLDFSSIENGSFMRLKSLESNEQIYYGYVGRALVTFICRYDAALSLFWPSDPLILVITSAIDGIKARIKPTTTHWTMRPTESEATFLRTYHCE